jgi:hypothetical protein
VYTRSSSTLTDTLGGAEKEGAANEVELQVQRILVEVEQLPGEVQAALLVRLVNGLASKVTPAIASKAVTAARTEALPTRSKVNSGKLRTSTRATSSEPDVPRPDSQLRLLKDPTDPVEAWERFGGSAAQLFDVLREEPAGVLEAMLSHRRMPLGPKPRGKSREKIAEAIAVRMEQHFRGY